MSKGLAVIYDRASTKKQEENYTRHDVKRIGAELAKRFAYELESEPRYETKSGEELRNRPVMLGILKDIEEGKTKEGKRIAAIIVPNFTRLSRDEDIIDGLVIKKSCGDHHVVVIDFKGKVYDFRNENDQDTAFLEFWFASRDKRQMMSNLMRGLKQKARQGEFMGGGPQLGYQLIPSGKTNQRGVPLKKKLIEPSEAELVRRIFSMYYDLGAKKIASTLNSQGVYLPVRRPTLLKKEKARSRPFTSSDIMRIVTNPIYAGWVRWGTGVNKYRTQSKYLDDLEPQLHFDPSLQIVSQEEFDRAQRILKERHHMPARAVSTRYAFSYILKCACCGNSMQGGPRYWPTTPEHLRHFYRCRTHDENPTVCPAGKTLRPYQIASGLFPLVVALVQDKMRLNEALETAAKEHSISGALQQLETETRAALEQTQQGIQRLLDLAADGVIEREELSSKLQELREKKERLTRDLQAFNESKAIKAEILEAMEFLKGDLEQVLWDLLEKNPQILARILRLVFEPHSVVVEAYYDKTVKGRSFVPGKRKGRIVDYKLNENFFKVAHVQQPSSQPEPSRKTIWRPLWSS